MKKLSFAGLCNEKRKKAEDYKKRSDQKEKGIENSETNPINVKPCRFGLFTLPALNLQPRNKRLDFQISAHCQKASLTDIQRSEIIIVEGGCLVCDGKSRVVKKIDWVTRIADSIEYQS